VLRFDCQSKGRGAAFDRRLLVYTVGELMTRELVTLHENDELESADELLELAHIRHLPVVRGRKLAGLVTHRDLLRHCGRRNASGATARARDAMTREVLTVRPDTPVVDATRLMLGNKFGCLPVTSADGTLLGIVTESDLLRVAAERAEELDRRDLSAEYEP
jgi:CBS domain-containing protein